MIKGQHIVNEDRLPGLWELWGYIDRSLNKLVQSPKLDVFCEVNQIVNRALEYHYADGEYTLGLKFPPEVELRELDARNKLWLERYLGAVLEFNRFDPYQQGGGYVYYTVKIPVGDEIDRVCPKHNDQDYWWDGSNWIAWD